MRVSRDDARDRVGRRTLACTVARLRTEGRAGRCRHFRFRCSFYRLGFAVQLGHLDDALLELAKGRLVLGALSARSRRLRLLHALRAGWNQDGIVNRGMLRPETP